MTSGVLQGQVMGPQVLMLNINDVNEGTEGIVTKFADDKDRCRDSCRVGKEVVDGMQCGKVQSYALDSKNRSIDYFLIGEWLWKSEVQRDLGVLVQDSLKVNMQVQLAVRNANAMLVFISIGLEYNSRDVLLRLYKDLIRPVFGILRAVLGPVFKVGRSGLGQGPEKCARMIP
eukprot:g29801.t1